MKRLSNERGIALAVAIFALVVVGGLIAGSFFVATLEQRVGRNTLQQQTAFNAAEAANQELALAWDADVYNKIAVGESLMTTGTTPDGGWYRRSLKRVNEMVYLVHTDGFNRDSTSRQRVGALLRLMPVEVHFNSALKTQGPVSIQGNSTVSGVDQQPTGWTGCDSLQPTLPAIRHPDTSQVDIGGNVTVTGDPTLLEDSTINDSTLTTFGDVNFDELKLMANKFLPAGTYTGIAPATDPVTGACDKSQPTNWGDPVNPGAACGQYYPFIWAEGPFHVSTGKGQGILVVNGDLTVTGNFEFYGPILVKGLLKSTGTGNKLNGGVIAANAAIEDQGVSALKGNATINYSSCAVSKALTYSAEGGQMRQRSWANLY